MGRRVVGTVLPSSSPSGQFTSPAFLESGHSYLCLISFLSADETMELLLMLLMLSKNGIKCTTNYEFILIIHDIRDITLTRRVRKEGVLII